MVITVAYEQGHGWWVKIPKSPMAETLGNNIMEHLVDFLKTQHGKIPEVLWGELHFLLRAGKYLKENQGLEITIKRKYSSKEYGTLLNASMSIKVVKQ